MDRIPDLPERCEGASSESGCDVALDVAFGQENSRAGEVVRRAGDDERAVMVAGQPVYCVCELSEDLSLRCDNAEFGIGGETLI